MSWLISSENQGKYKHSQVLFRSCYIKLLNTFKETFNIKILNSIKLFHHPTSILKTPINTKNCLRLKFRENFQLILPLELLIASSIHSHEKLQNELKVLSFKAKQTNKVPPALHVRLHSQLKCMHEFMCKYKE